MNINDRTNSFDRTDIDQNKVIAALSYLGILFFLPLVACPNSKFGRFHANQGLILLICSVLGSIVGSFLGFIPIIGSLVAAVISLAVFILFLFGLINTLNGFAKELPFIGNISIIK